MKFTSTTVSHDDDDLVEVTVEERVLVFVVKVVEVEETVRGLPPSLVLETVTVKYSVLVTVIVEVRNVVSVTMLMFEGPAKAE